MRKFNYFLCFVCFVAMSQPVVANDIVKSAVDKAIDAGFTEFERKVIGKYYKKDEYEEDRKSTSRKDRKKSKKSKKGLPPGLAKKDKLPPGLEMQLQKNGSLPPGLAKRDLPDDLKSELPEPREGYERRIIEDAAVVLIHKASGKVVDIIKDVVLGNER